jgi:hypothetical protein
MFLLAASWVFPIGCRPHAHLHTDQTGLSPSNPIGCQSQNNIIPLLTLTPNNHNSAPLQANFQSSSRYSHNANPKQNNVLPSTPMYETINMFLKKRLLNFICHNHKDKKQ